MLAQGVRLPAHLTGLGKGLHKLLKLHRVCKNNKVCKVSGSGTCMLADATKASSQLSLHDADQAAAALAADRDHLRQTPAAPWSQPHLRMPWKLWSAPAGPAMVTHVAAAEIGVDQCVAMILTLSSMPSMLPPSSYSRENSLGCTRPASGTDLIAMRGILATAVGDSVT